MIVYELDEQSIWTGGTREIAPWEGRPACCTTIAPPDVPDGQMAQLRGQTWVLIDSVPLSDVQRRAHEARAKVNEWRDKSLNDGVPYTMPDGREDTIQTRPDDRLNLMALNSKAVARVETGDTTPMPFRGLSNTTYQLTPTEMRDMTMAALTHIEDIYKQSWSAKDALVTATTLDDVEAALEGLL
ncbi:DUF4376 domain-containing protein [Halomonas elongata]|uniref:DUF4376 domain-containing protein n=1 Tax=Halomonas elongata TaxID=2746 RepID=UPI002E29492F|nr:DUF4376 domain-containing protein [Halomonas elongata]WVI73236.1 DUF4376 domain-containing protein [Halomonas elongata]